MPIDLRSSSGVTTAVVSGVLDEAGGHDLSSEVMRAVPRGGKLVVDGTGLTELDQHGVIHLMTVQRWAEHASRRRLLVAGFNGPIWRTILENGGDLLFENKATWADALAALGVTAPPTAPFAPPRTLEPGAPVEPSATQWEPKDFGAGMQEEASPWNDYAPPQPTPKPKKGRSRRRLIFLGVISALGLPIVLGSWWLASRRAPELFVSKAEIEVEENGKEADEVLVETRRGQLLDSSWADLPKGLYFEGPMEESADNAYILRGTAAAGAQSATVTLVAQGTDGKTSGPITFTVRVTKKPHTWQLDSLETVPLEAGKELGAPIKFLLGSQQAPTAANLPQGLKVQRTPGSDDWQLAGRPVAAGDYRVLFSAAGSDNTAETYERVLKVAPAPSPPAELTKEVRPPPPSTVDDSMRRFLLTRIERLPARYTKEDRENLRIVVRGLKKARTAAVLHFEREGQVELSEAEAGKLKAALRLPENADLLKSPDCQLVVVGFASRTGTPAANVRISKTRAAAVDAVLQNTLGRRADLCGDYGPTDAVDPQAPDSNRAVEVYLGTLDVPPYLVPRAQAFKEDFNRRHGVR